MKKKILEGAARDHLVVWIRHRMNEFGITPDAIAESIRNDHLHPSLLYRDAKGNEWNGVGDMPDWLLAARHAGVDPEFFLIERRGQQPEAPTQSEENAVSFPWSGSGER